MSRVLIQSPQAQAVWDFRMGMPAGITFSRSSVGSPATYFGSDGIMHTAAADVPRFDCDPVTHAARGLLIEAARTNMMTQGSGIATWSSSNATCAASSTLAPNGAAEAALITTLGTGWGVVKRQVTVPATSLPYTVSVFLAPGTATYTTVRLQFYNGTTGSQQATVHWPSRSVDASSTTATRYRLVDCGIWVRLDFTVTNSGADTLAEVQIYPTGIPGGATATGSVSAWGAQVEQGDGATSYIPTTTAAVARAADIARAMASGITSWSRLTAGTFLFEFEQTIFPGPEAAFSAGLINAGNTSVIDVYLQSSVQSYQARQRDASTTRAKVITGTIHAGVTRVALAYQSTGSLSLCVDGGDVLSAAVDQSHWQADLSIVNFGGNQTRHRRCLIYPSYLSASHMQALTS